METPHFIVLISLLQAIGFDLKYMEKLPGNEEDTFYSITIKSPSTHEQALLTSCKQVSPPSWLPYQLSWHNIYNL